MEQSVKQEAHINASVWDSESSDKEVYAPELEQVAKRARLKYE